MNILVKSFLICSLFCISLFSTAVFAQKQKRIKTKSAIQATTVKSSEFEKEILAEINLLRTDPKLYVKLLEEMKGSVTGKTVQYPGGFRIEMIEGVAAISEAINSLKNTAAISPLAYTDGLSKASKEQLMNLQENLALQHDGKDGSDVGGRLFKYGIPGKFYSENISLYMRTAREIVVQMIIDDGIKARIHRVNLLSGQYKLVGISQGTGQKGGEICVIVFADKFTDR